MPAALSGIRVVEIATGLAGPMAAMMLADFGAEVVRIEMPGAAGDQDRPGYPLWGRGKAGIALDPSEPADQDRLRYLIDRADVCVSVPSLTRQWPGAEPAAATARNPALVYLSVPPYLPDVTPWAGDMESNSLLSAAMGPSLRQSSFSGGPVDPVYPHLLYVQAVWAATCAVAALIEREQSGAGQVVTVGGVHAAQAASLSSMIIRPGQPDPNTAVGPGGPSSNYTRYRCADGRWVFLAALLPKFQERALAVLGFTDLLERARTEGVAAVIGPARRAEVRPRFEAAFASRTSDEWLAAFKAADVPIARVEDREHWLDHPQIRAIGMAASVTDPGRGEILMPASPVHLSATPASAPAAGPTLAPPGQGLPDWPAKTVAGGVPAVSDGLPAAKAGPLDGIRVIDTGVVLAGPYAGTLLAELGADVIKVEVPAGDPFRVNGFSYIRGQRGIALDLSAPRGRAVFADFVRSADIVIDNYRPGVAGRLGVSYDHVRKLTPDIISMSISAFGESGPLREEAGFDTVLQAMSGVMSAQGGESEPVTLSLAINDTATALLTAFAACVALLYRARGGTGQRGTLSLAASSVFMQSEELVRVAGRPEPVSGGADFPGPGAADRFYQTADGWIRVQATSGSARAALTELAGLPATDAGDDGARDDNADEKLQAAVEAYLGARPGARAQAELTAAGVPAVVARRVSELADDVDLASWEIHQPISTNLGGHILAVGRMARFSRTQRRDALVPPGVGEHSRQLLTEAGYDDAAIDSLSADGVIREGEPMHIPDVAPYR